MTAEEGIVKVDGSFVTNVGAGNTTSNPDNASMLGGRGNTMTSVSQGVIIGGSGNTMSSLQAFV
ncbi:MAG: hypothetical protein LBD11_01240 [Candidatus Peribacteria bacterium]|nr:hypothetical protein [Candidatus Peribacteria bacterium]